MMEGSKRSSSAPPRMPAETRHSSTSCHTPSPSTSPKTLCTPSSARSTERSTAASTPQPDDATDQHAFGAQCEQVEEMKRVKGACQETVQVVIPQSHDSRPSTKDRTTGISSGRCPIIPFDTHNANHPQPIYNGGTQRFELLGCPLLTANDVASSPKMSLSPICGQHFLEVNNTLLENICPANLIDAPCAHDELPGGCHKLRLCRTKRKFPDLRGYRPKALSFGNFYGASAVCWHHAKGECWYLHDIMPTCRGIQKQLLDPLRQFQEELCDKLSTSRHCIWGHDLVGARTAAIFKYEQHQHEAHLLGAQDRVLHYLKITKQVQHYWRPKPADLACLYDLRSYGDGIVAGWTYHGFYIVRTGIKASSLRNVDAWYRKYHGLPGAVKNSETDIPGWSNPHVGILASWIPAGVYPT